jgi:DNA-binding MarR family transcriptional regulator
MATEKIVAIAPAPARTSTDPQAGGESDVRELLGTMNQLVKLARDIGSRVRELDRVPPFRSPLAEAAADHAVASGSEALVEAAMALIAQHRRQPLFDAPALFDNRNWLLVLELFIAGCKNADVSVKDASLALGGATSTALRRLLTLEQLGIITSRDDPGDGRRRLVGLSDRATDAVRAYLAACGQNGAGLAQFRLRLRMAQAGAAPSAEVVGEGDAEDRLAQLQARTVSEPKWVSQS